MINWIKRINNWWLDIDDRAMLATFNNPTDKVAIAIALATIVLLTISLIKVMITFSIPWLIVLIAVSAEMVWSWIGKPICRRYQ